MRWRGWRRSCPRRWHVTDRLDRLEAELSAMRPRAVSPELAGRIESSITNVNARPWGDRFLLSSMASGAIAACVIVAVLATQPSAPLRPGAPMNAMTTPVPRVGDYPLVLARADADWIDAVK